MSSVNPQEKEISDLPNAEDDDHEFKSSLTPIKELAKKIERAVSGFANSGGGYFIAGVDNQGNADGGLPETVGRQDVRDWCDQVIHHVEPTPEYTISLSSDPKGRGNIKSSHCVLLLSVHDSHVPPHMASDGRYYIRAGAHTVKARHFIVDALFAKRHAQEPRLSHLFRFKPGNPGIVQLGVAALTPSPALNVEVCLSPVPDILKARSGTNYFPIHVPVIDSENPFYMDAATWFQAEERFGEEVDLQVRYRDLANNELIYEATLQINSSLPQIVIGNDWKERIARTLERIEKKIKQ